MKAALLRRCALAAGLASLLLGPAISAEERPSFRPAPPAALPKPASPDRLVLKIALNPPALSPVDACFQGLGGSSFPRWVRAIQKAPAPAIPEYWGRLKSGEAFLGLSIDRPEGPFRMLNEPLAFRDPAHFRSFARSRLFRVMAANQAKQDGILPVAAAYAGQQALLSKRPIASLDDFKGMRVRSFSQGLFPRLGGTAVAAGLAEVKPALERSVLDAAETLPVLISSLRLHESARNLYLTGFITETVLFSVQSKAWSALPLERRKELAGWFSQAAETCSRANYDAESRALKELESKGVWIFPFDAAKVRAKVPAPKGGPGWTAAMWNELQALK